MGNSLNKRLKVALEQRSGMLVPGAANALTARVIEDLGFDAIYVSGAGIANTYLGTPDIGLVTLTELAQHVAVMRDAVTLPLIVDADTGFGNPVNVGRTIKVLERSGANAVQLEDQDFPKKCGHFSGKSVIPAAEMVMKVKAAADSRIDPDFLIIARTDAIACNGLADAMDRAHAYIEAGADVTFVEAPGSVADMERIARELPAPQVLNLVVGGLTPIVEIEDLRRMGFAMVLYANAALQAAVFGMQRALGRLRETGSLHELSDLLVDFSERQRLVAKPSYDELEVRYSIREKAQVPG